VRTSQVSASTLPGLELLNPNLVFGTAWFWTLPEVHEVQKEIDTLTRQFRRYIGLSERLARASRLQCGHDVAQPNALMAVEEEVAAAQLASLNQERG
jgi:hypothetical protein